MPERGKDKEREIALVTGELDKENVIVSYTDNLLQYLLLLQQIWNMSTMYVTFL